jgi:aspartate aminotransferase
MIPSSSRMASLKTSPASILAKRARALRATGRDIILLSSGEVEFPTPPHVIKAAQHAAHAVPVGYTNVDGSVELKEAVRGKFARENDLDLNLDEIIICNGSKQAMFNALMATVVPGDEVIVPAPYWASYLDLVVIAGATPVVVRTAASSDWKLTPEDLHRAITARTRWVIINNPVNPTGGVYSAAELQGLSEVLVRHPDVLVMSDDLYEHIIFDNTSFATMASAAPSMKERTLTVNGVSKSYAMMGWRIGYGAGPSTLIADMVKVQSQSTSNASTVSQAAAEAALNGPQEEIKRRQDLLAEARSKVVRAVTAMPGLSLRSPAGTFYAFVSCETLLQTPNAAARDLRTDGDVARFLLDHAGVVVLPGDDCGLSPFFRINFGCSTQVLDEALRRIGRAVESIYSGSQPAANSGLIP